MQLVRFRCQGSTLRCPRAAEQKRKIAQRITDVMVEETGTVREGVALAFYEFSEESYARGGVLISDT